MRIKSLNVYKVQALGFPSLTYVYMCYMLVQRWTGAVVFMIVW